VAEDLLVEPEKPGSEVAALAVTDRWFLSTTRA